MAKFRHILRVGRSGRFFFPHQPDFFRALGAMVDLSAFPLGPLRFCPADERVEGVRKALGDIMIAKALPLVLASKIHGKLMFLSSQYFGRLGRALLRAFSRRQHEHGRNS